MDIYKHFNEDTKWTIRCHKSKTDTQYNSQPNLISFLIEKEVIISNINIHIELMNQKEEVFTKELNFRGTDWLKCIF